MGKQNRDKDMKQELTDEQYQITQEKGTEPAFSGELLYNKEDGSYRCICCDKELFRSDTKYESDSGWPSFWAAASDGAIRTELDTSHGMRRLEVQCDHCGAHLGHVFPDGPDPSGQRYCINSAALSFDENDKSE